MTVKNSNGQVFYGMHFYPGVAEYSEPGKEPYRIFINEDTIRSMSPTFAGCPIFVEHVDEVNPNLNKLREEADGWVVESFYNAADGKTWAKFIVVSERGLAAIRNGFKLSNAYIPKGFGQGGLWNGVTYAKEVTAGEFEHLAIVRNPRYEESEILSPEQFKRYNEEKEIELKKLANSKEERKGELMFFKKTKVENSKDFEAMSVTLPKSKKEMTLAEMVEKMDKIENMQGYANDEHMVKVGDGEMSVKNLSEKYMAACNELDEMKKNKDGADVELEKEKKEIDVEGDMKNDDADGDSDGDKKENEEDEEKEKKENEEKEAADEKKQNALEKARADKAAKAARFEALKNAQNNVSDEVARVDLMEDQVARGRARYGS